MKSLASLVGAVVLVVGCATSPGSGSVAQSTNEDSPTISTKKRGKALNLYLNSIINMRRGDYKSGIESMRDAADIDTESRELLLRLLAVYYRDGDYKNAATMAERALVKQPDSVMLHIWLGRIYTQLGRVDDSVDMFQQAIALDPESQQAYEALAEVEEESNDLVGAVTVYESMIKQTPDSPFLHYRLGVNLMEMGDSEGARKSLEKALSLDDSLAAARYVLGVIYMDLEEWDLAGKTFERFLTDNPDHAPSLENSAAILARIGNFDEAFTILTRLIESKDVDVRHHLQRTYTYLRDTASSRSFISAAPNDAPFLGTAFQILVKRREGEPYEALVKSIDAIEGDLDFECSAYLSSLLTRYGTEEAGGFIVSEIQSLLDEKMESKVLLTILGRALMYTDRTEEAKNAFLEVMKDYGEDRMTHYYLATAYEGLGDAENAEIHLRKTLEYDPNDPDVLNFLGYLLAEEDLRLKEAEEMIERALANDPGNGFYLDSLGWVYYRQGKGQKAVDYIKRAIRSMSSDDAILRDHLGDAYLLNRQVDEALNEWRRARRLDPELEGVQEKIDKHKKDKGKRSGT
jgi:tetratricopeptide (TPR) repeat protein